MRFLLVVLIAFACASCGTLYVQTDHEEDFNLSAYETYNYDFEETGLNELDERRFVRFSDSILTRRGFTKSDSPQLYITLFKEEAEAPTDTNLGVGVAGGGGNVGVNIGGGIPIGGSKLQQQMTVKFWDASNNTLLWEAYAEGSKKFQMTPEKRTEFMKKWVTTIFKKLARDQN